MSDLLLADMTTKQCIFFVCAAVTEAIPIIRSSKSNNGTSRVYWLASGENYVRVRKYLFRWTHLNFAHNFCPILWFLFADNSDKHC